MRLRVLRSLLSWASWLPIWLRFRFPLPINPVIHPRPSSLSPSPHVPPRVEPDQTTTLCLLLVTTAMSFSHSLTDEEKRSIEFDKRSTDHLSSAQVSIFLFFSSPLGCKADAPDTFCRKIRSKRVLLSTNTTTQTLTQRPLRLKMNPRIQKSVLRLPTPMIPRCRRLPSVLGSSVSSGPSSFPA